MFLHCILSSSRCALSLLFNPSQYGSLCWCHSHFFTHFSVSMWEACPKYLSCCLCNSCPVYAVGCFRVCSRTALLLTVVISVVQAQTVTDVTVGWRLRAQVYDVFFVGFSMSLVRCDAQMWTYVKKMWWTRHDVDGKTFSCCLYARFWSFFHSYFAADLCTSNHCVATACLSTYTDFYSV